MLKNILKKAPERTVIVTTHRPTVLTMCHQVYRVVDKKISKLNEQVKQMTQDLALLKNELEEKTKP